MPYWLKMDCSFWIAKLFGFRRKGGNFFSISENSIKIMKCLYLSVWMVLWTAKVVGNCLRSSGKMDTYQRGGDRVYGLKRREFVW